MKELSYPFDSNYILAKKRNIKKTLLAQEGKLLEKNIAILGGSTTSEIKAILELFLLNYGIKANFYESEYNKYYEDVMFDEPELEAFKPSLIYIHTTNKNVMYEPDYLASAEEVENCLLSEYNRFVALWEKIASKYHCPIIQNNFEWPNYRLMGNLEASSINGKINFLSRLNLKFYEYAQTHQNFYINDINYLSASYGLEKWSEPFYWYMYKYALALPAIPSLAFNIANIIKALYGKNKKGLVLDLDETLWGGIVGDDGVENLKIGPEMPAGQAYSDFQIYLKNLKNLGMVLNIASKNEEENALAGLNHKDGILKPEDFIVIKANWEPKSVNFKHIANELNLGEDALVFVDDNPAERAIIQRELPNVSIPPITVPENYINTVSHSGFFEFTSISEDDLKRNEMYRENAKRSSLVASFDNYEDYLLSLKMKAKIKDFEKIYYERIAQLSNKSNQFNLTTRRYTQSEIEAFATNDEYIKIYGQLADMFGDNGLVTVVLGKVEEAVLHLELWLMSCRVLKRNMEYAMLDKLVAMGKARGIRELKGYYYPTAKNKMVKDFYGTLGFEKTKEDAAGNSEWRFIIPEVYENKNKVIEVEN